MTKAACRFVTYSWIIVYPANEDDKVDGEMRHGAGIPETKLQINVYTKLLWYVAIH